MALNLVSVCLCLNCAAGQVTAAAADGAGPTSASPLPGRPCASRAVPVLAEPLPRLLAAVVLTSVPKAGLPEGEAGPVLLTILNLLCVH